MKFAVQLYSMRFFIKEHGVEAALKVIAEAGYQGVEFAGFYGMSAEDLQALLDKYNLKAISAHVGVSEVVEQLPILKKLGINCCVIPYIDFNRSVSFADGLKMCRDAYKVLSENGISIGYHNHSHEFINGADYVSDLAENMPEMQFEPDVFWLAVAGIDAIGLMQKYKDRLCFLHLKELGESESGVNPVLGEGRAKIADVVKLGKELGVEWSILEVEKIDMPMSEYLTKSYNFIKKYA